MRISGYNKKFRLEVIKSAVLGYENQCRRNDIGEIPLHRPREFMQEERRKKKLLTKTSWYRPFDAVGFFPPTPGAKLAKILQEIVTEETSRINMKAKVVETGGKKIGQQLSNHDLTGCIFPDCLLCESGEKGASHTRSGAVYSGVCTLCEEKGTKSIYHGETGYSAYQRTKKHRKDIEREDMNNAFAKHLALHHPEHTKDASVFKIKSERTFRKCLERQVAEGVDITRSEADILMNSKSEYHQPAVTRVTTTRETRERGVGS